MLLSRCYRAWPKTTTCSSSCPTAIRAVPVSQPKRRSPPSRSASSCSGRSARRRRWTGTRARELGSACSSSSTSTRRSSATRTVALVRGPASLRAAIGCENDDDISVDACYRFNRKLVEHPELLERLDALIVAAVLEAEPRLRDTPVAVDATDAEAYANGQRYVRRGGPERKHFSDPDASWGHRSAVSTHAVGSFYGYKLHAVIAPHADASVPEVILAHRPATAKDAEQVHGHKLIEASPAAPPGPSSSPTPATTASPSPSAASRTASPPSSRACRSAAPARTRPKSLTTRLSASTAPGPSPASTTSTAPPSGAARPANATPRACGCPSAAATRSSPIKSRRWKEAHRPPAHRRRARLRAPQEQPQPQRAAHPRPDARLRALQHGRHRAQPRRAPTPAERLTPRRPDPSGVLTPSAPLPAASTRPVTPDRRTRCHHGSVPRPTGHPTAPDSRPDRHSGNTPVDTPDSPRALTRPFRHSPPQPQRGFRPRGAGRARGPERGGSRRCPRRPGSRSPLTPGFRILSLRRATGGRTSPRAAAAAHGTTVSAASVGGAAPKP